MIIQSHLGYQSILIYSFSGHQLEWRTEAESESGKGCVSRQ